MDLLLGIDLGATNLRVAIAASEGNDPADATPEPTLLARIERPTPRAPTGDTVTDALVTAVTDACDRANVSPHELAAAGVGTIGPIDSGAGAVVRPPNVPADRIEIVGPLAAALDTDASRIAFHNDCVAGVLGERVFAGAPENAAYLSLSTGIGVGASVDGVLLSGHRGNAAEMGHVVVDPAGRLDCGCGAPGHWEAYCSGSAIPRLAALLAREEGLDTSLALPNDEAVAQSADVPVPVDAPAVFEAADGGDPLATRTVEEVARLNALGVAATVHAFAPEALSVGGAVALENPEAVIDPIRERLPAHLAIEPPTVAPAALGADAVLFGALAAARRRV